ncbi:MAG: O-antigen polymerase [Candidatus Binataceae bacterium]
MYWTLALLVELLLVLQVVLATIQFRSWQAPGAFFALLWTIFVAACLIVAPEYKIWPGVIWFFLMSCVVQLGATAGKACVGSSSARSRTRALSVRALRWGVSICTVLGIIGVEILLRSVGRGFSTLISPTDLFVTGIVFSYERYAVAGFREPAGFVALLTFIYFGAYLSGALFVVAERARTRAATMLIAVPALLVGLTLTTRGPLLVTAVNWAAAYLTISIWRGREKAFVLLDYRRSVAIGAAIVGLILVYVGLQSIRNGDVIREHAKRESQVEWGLANAKSAFVGSLPAFSHWFEDKWDVGTPQTWGAYAFATDLQWLGVPSENFSEVPVSPDLDAPPTNMFTIYRIFAQDFGVPGSALFMLLFGILGGWAYESVKRGNLASAPFLIVFYQISFISLTGFGLRGTTLQGAFLLLIIFMWWASSRARNRAPSTFRAASLAQNRA